MTDNDILTILKIDLQVSSGVLDSYLLTLIEAARGYIRQEGVALSTSSEDSLLVEMYAAYLYRQRREEDTQMPRMLRWALNNRIIGEAGNG